MHGADHGRKGWIFSKPFDEKWKNAEQDDHAAETQERDVVTQVLGVPSKTMLSIDWAKAIICHIVSWTELGELLTHFKLYQRLRGMK